MGVSTHDLPLPPGDSETIARATAGPAIIGTFLTMILYGPLVFQTLTYFRGAKTDTIPWRKYLVVWVLFWTTLVVITEGQTAYDYAVHIGTPQYLYTVTWQAAFYNSSTVPIAVVVQFFYGWQIKTLTKRIELAILVWILALFQFSGQLGALIWGILLGDYRLWDPIKPVVYVWLVGTAVTDILIAVILVIYLRSRMTGFSGTDDMLHRVSRYAVQTGAVTAIWATLDLILFVSLPNNNDHYIFNFPLSALYANCLLASLNARSDWFVQSEVSTVDRKRMSGRPSRRTSRQQGSGTHETDTLFDLQPLSGNQPSAAPGEARQKDRSPHRPLSFPSTVESTVVGTSLYSPIENLMRLETGSDRGLTLPPNAELSPTSRVHSSPRHRTSRRVVSEKSSPNGSAGQLV